MERKIPTKDELSQILKQIKETYEKENKKEKENVR